MQEPDHGPQAHTPPSLSRGFPEEPGKPALGAPHDGYSAVVLAIVLGFVYFGFGTSRLLMNSQENFGWLALLMLAVCVLVCVPAWKYFARAHGIKERGAPPLLPMLAFYFALMGLTLFVLPVLVSAFENWWSFAFACLILATLNVAPVRISLLRSPDEAPESRISSGS